MPLSFSLIANDIERIRTVEKIKKNSKSIESKSALFDTGLLFGKFTAKKPKKDGKSIVSNSIKMCYNKTMTKKKIPTKKPSNRNITKDENPVNTLTNGADLQDKNKTKEVKEEIKKNQEEAVKPFQKDNKLRCKKCGAVIAPEITNPKMSALCDKCVG